MGRKIPGKKHRGIKDPEKQQAKRLSVLLPKINAPPRNIEDQDIPKSLERVIKLKNAVKNNSLVIKKKKKKRNKLISVGKIGSKFTHPKAKPEKVTPVFEQRPGESQYHFLARVNRETHNFIQETEFETKFNVEVKRNIDTGEVEGITRKEKDELLEYAKLIKQQKKKKKINNKELPKLTRAEKKKQKLLEKVQKKNKDKIDEFKTFQDKIEFGEIVHAPPDLKTRPRTAAEKHINKVNSKSLLLTSLLSQRKEDLIHNSKINDRTGKRKNLSLGERRQLDKQQIEAIAAYRTLKAKDKIRS